MAVFGVFGVKTENVASNPYTREKRRRRSRRYRRRLDLCVEAHITRNRYSTLRLPSLHQKHQILPYFFSYGLRVSPTFLATQRHHC